MNQRCVTNSRSFEDVKKAAPSTEMNLAFGILIHDAPLQQEYRSSVSGRRNWVNGTNVVKGVPVVMGLPWLAKNLVLMRLLRLTDGQKLWIEQPIRHNIER